MLLDDRGQRGPIRPVTIDNRELNIRGPAGETATALFLVQPQSDQFAAFQRLLDRSFQILVIQTSPDSQHMNRVVRMQLVPLQHQLLEAVEPGHPV